MARAPRRKKPTAEEVVEVSREEMVEAPVPDLTASDLAALRDQARRIYAGLHVPHAGQPRPAEVWGDLERQSQALADLAGKLAAYFGGQP